MCASCRENGFQWRCHDCLAEPVLCSDCCRNMHGRLPFHRVSKWKDNTFCRSSLLKAGVTLDLGHGGNNEDDESDGDDEFFEVVSGGIQFEKMRLRKDLDRDGNPILLIVDINGIHQIRARFCRCAHGRDIQRNVQLLQMGLYPATDGKPKTAFTFRLLDNLITDNLETKTTIVKYYAKLQRLTSEPFAHLVPDQTRELQRANREWRNIRHIQRAGFAHDKERAIGEDDLALFCPTCPQPGINLPSDYLTDSQRPFLSIHTSGSWKYKRTLSADGNFKQDHYIMKNPTDDVKLSDGHGYMVSRGPYQEYLKNNPHSSTEKSTCNEHRAVNNQNVSRAHLDCTGIGAIACGRHGCFYPHSVVDFQKGEQQRNMDYAFVQAINYIKVLLLILMLYDVMCQYWIKFLFRIDKAVGLSIPANLDIHRGIGLFHVHGHQKDCFARYAPTFIPGTGMLDGEIIETLWSVLNDTASSARAMSISHRQEYLDAHMYDSNYKKMIHMVPTLLRKWKRTLPMVVESQSDFRYLDLAVTAKERKEWGALESAAQRDRNVNVEAMDIYDVREAPTKAELEHFLANKEQSDSNPEGCAAWISMGVAITEKQYVS
ncbi:hypothetical protein K474DRAFT_1686991 [Panus rudis PR-1116 ss-1]|nr:hypothetical protein K474DRAFT_1686991 [Panus rudis PR-1116 ss-1]